jgi:AAA domain
MIEETVNPFAPGDHGDYTAETNKPKIRVINGGARQEEQTEQEEAPPIGLGEWDAGDDTEAPPPRAWLLGNIFCRMFLSSLLGDGGVGKTAARIALQNHWSRREAEDAQYVAEDERRLRSESVCYLCTLA